MDQQRVRVEQDGPVLLVGLDRPDKRNAFDMAMLEELAMAYAEVDRNDTIRAGVLYGRGPHFTAGFDLREVVPRLQAGERLVPEGGIDPWGLDPDAIRKPIVAATHGKCLTLGIELLLAADVRVAAETASFAQLEVGRGIFPFGGATLRFPQVAGWGNAMRWMLTGEEFDATEALRLGLIQEVVADGIHVERAVEIAHQIARQAPLGVEATLRSARLAARNGIAAAEVELLGEVRRLLASEDASRALGAFLTGEPVDFVGR